MLQKILLPAIAVFLCVFAENRTFAVQEDEFAVVNEILFELATLLVPVGKLANNLEYVIDELSIPPLTYNFNREICVNASCEAISEQMQLIEAVLRNPHQIETQLDFQPSSFSYSVTAKNLSLDCDPFQRIITYLSTGNQRVYGGLHMNVADSIFGIAGKLQIVPKVGIQVSKLNVILELGQLRISIPEVSSYVEGTWTNEPPIYLDHAAEVKELWNGVDENGVTLKTRYERSLEARINCLLSGDESCGNRQ